MGYSDGLRGRKYAKSRPKRVGLGGDYGWVWIYDLDYASALLIDFIYDEDAAKDMPKPTMPDEPKVTSPQN